MVCLIWRKTVGGGKDGEREREREIDGEIGKRERERGRESRRG